MANVPVVQNKSTLLLGPDSWLINGAPQAFPGDTVALEVIDPTGARLADVTASFTDSTNTAATAQFLVTIPTMTVTIGSSGSPSYNIVSAPYLFQFRVDLSGGGSQYMNQFGVHVAGNLGDF